MVAAVGHFVLWALATAVNWLIAGLGAFIGWAVSALPLMPSAGPTPPGSVLSIVNYFLPVGALVAGLALFVSLWGVFLIVRIPLRWAKVV